jgi:membrane-bound metal-dependent hydrolase YbcI (DUF457 family)
MFVGHYGPAAAVAGPKINLWRGFIAVQFLDILWAPLVLAGVERVRIVPHFTAANHFDLYHMPYTHSLPMAALWSLAAALACRGLARKAGWAGAGLVGALVFSHWLLDFVVHKPDLLLWFGGEKVGLGLWDNRALSFGLEMTLYLGALAIYASRTAARGLAGRITLPLLAVVGAGLQVFGNWGPPPAGPHEAAITALVAYTVFALLAASVDATRRFKSV